MNEAFDLDLGVWVYADRRFPHRRDAILMSNNDNHHRLSISDTDLRAVGYKPKTNLRRAHFYIRSGMTHSASNGGQMSFEHRRGRDVLYERLRRKESIQIGLKPWYKCEFDTKCGFCPTTITPKKSFVNLNYYDQVFCEKKSLLFPSFQPDILLRNGLTGEELWIEIHNEKPVSDTPEKIYTGVPIFERDCSDSTDIEYISKLTTMYDGNHCRIYNAWNLPCFKGVEINCSIFLKNYDLRKTVSSFMYVHPDGRKIPAVQGDYGWIPIIDGKWHSIKEVTSQGFSLTGVEISDI